MLFEQLFEMLNRIQTERAFLEKENIRLKGLRNTLDIAEFHQEELILKEYFKHPRSFKQNFINRCRLRNSAAGASFAFALLEYLSLANMLYLGFAKQIYSVSDGKKTYLPATKFLYLFAPEVTHIIEYKLVPTNRANSEKHLEICTVPIAEIHFQEFIVDEWIMHQQYLFKVSSLNELELAQQEELCTQLFKQYPAFAAKIYARNRNLADLYEDIQFYRNKKTLRQVLLESSMRTFLLKLREFDDEVSTLLLNNVIMDFFNFIDNIPKQWLNEILSEEEEEGDHFFRKFFQMIDEVSDDKTSNVKVARKIRAFINQMPPGNFFDTPVPFNGTLRNCYPLSEDGMPNFFNAVTDESSLQLPSVLVELIFTEQAITTKKQFINLVYSIPADSYRNFFQKVRFQGIQPLAIIRNIQEFLSISQIKLLAPLTRYFYDCATVGAYENILACRSPLFLKEFLQSFPAKERVALLKNKEKFGNYFAITLTASLEHIEVLLSSLPEDELIRFIDDIEDGIIALSAEQKVITLWPAYEKLFTLMLTRPAPLLSVLKKLTMNEWQKQETADQTAVFNFLCSKIDDPLLMQLISLRDDNKDGIFHFCDGQLLEFLVTRLDKKRVQKLLLEKNAQGNTPLHFILQSQCSFALIENVFPRQQWPSLLSIANLKGENVLYQIPVAEAYAGFVGNKKYRRKLAPALLAKTSSGNNAFMKFLSSEPNYFPAFAQCLSKEELLRVIAESKAQQKNILFLLPANKTLEMFGEIFSSGEIVNILINNRDFLNRYYYFSNFQELKKICALTPGQEKKLLAGMLACCDKKIKFEQIALINYEWLVKHLRAKPKTELRAIFNKAGFHVPEDALCAKNYAEIADIFLTAIAFNEYELCSWLDTQQASLPPYLLPIMLKHLSTERLPTAKNWKKRWLTFDRPTIKRIMALFSLQELGELLKPRSGEPLPEFILSEDILKQLPAQDICSILVFTNNNGQSLLSSNLHNPQIFTLLLRYIHPLMLINTLNRLETVPIFNRCVFDDKNRQKLLTSDILICEPSCEDACKALQEFFNKESLTHIIKENDLSSLLQIIFYGNEIPSLLLNALSPAELLDMAILEKHAYFSFFNSVFAKNKLFRLLNSRLSTEGSSYAQFYTQISLHKTTMIKLLLSHPDSCKEFLKTWQSRLPTDDEGNTLLHELALNDDNTILPYLVNIIGEEQWLDALLQQNNNGDTPLHIAAGSAEGNFPYFWQQLSDAGKETIAMQKNNNGFTIAHCAALVPEILGLIRDGLSMLLWEKLHTITTANGDSLWHLAIPCKSSVALLLTRTPDVKYENIRSDRMQSHCAYIRDNNLLRLALSYSESLIILLDSFPPTERLQRIQETDSEGIPLFNRCLGQAKLMAVVLNYFSAADLLSWLQQQRYLKNFSFLLTDIIALWLKHLADLTWQWCQHVETGEPNLFALAPHAQLVTDILTCSNNKKEVLLLQDGQGIFFISRCLRFPKSCSAVLTAAPLEFTAIFTSHEHLFTELWGNSDTLTVVVEKSPQLLIDYLLKKNERRFLNIEQIVPYSRNCQLLIPLLPETKKKWLADNLHFENWLNHPSAYQEIRKFLGYEDLSLWEINNIFSSNGKFYQAFLKGVNWHDFAAGIQGINTIALCRKTLVELQEKLGEHTEAPSQGVRSLLKSMHAWLQKSPSPQIAKMPNYSYQPIAEQYSALLKKWQLKEETLPQNLTANSFFCRQTPPCSGDQKKKASTAEFSRKFP